MTIEVLGGGIHRTGTVSLREALNILGYKCLPASPSPLDAIRQKGEVHARTKCYHSFDSFPHTPEILPVTSGATFPLGNKFMWDLGLGRWNNDLRPACDAFFGPGGYDAAVDQCWAYPELRRAYPDAKVILTVRDPEEWYRSYMTNLVAFDACAMIADLDAGGHLGNGVSPFHPGAMGVMRILGSDYRKERAIQIFNEWNEAIKAEVPSEKLLVLDVRQGWEPLCRFLIRIGSLMFGWNDSE
ncbi:hypothetical protein DFJ74DRAFT_702056 [Hyaloraphidium curvatum]|nr:hypothetical protein DFJ74DRAFT_702056 [Hyaloraphidium curvatum]